MVSRAPTAARPRAALAAAAAPAAAAGRALAACRARARAPASAGVAGEPPAAAQPVRPPPADVQLVSPGARLPARARRQAVLSLLVVLLLLFVGKVPGGARLGGRAGQEAARARAAGPAAVRRRRAAVPRGDPELGPVVRPAHAQRSRTQGVQGLPARRVQRGEHHVLARVRGAEAGDRPRRRGGEGALHLRGLHLHLVAQGGVAGLARARGGQPQHGGAHAAHVRRGPAADLHAHAPRLVPAVRQLAAVQGAGAALHGRAGVVARVRARARARVRAPRRRAAVTSAAATRVARPLTCRGTEPPRPHRDTSVLVENIFYSVHI